MSTYLERIADVRMAQILAASPAVIITGARGCGKTTTALRHAASVIRLDTPRAAATVEADPDAALRDQDEPLLLDEWQVCPSVVGAVKRAVDTERRPGRFILTGSARFDTDTGLWPGIGRLIRIAMHPMTVREQLGRPADSFFSRLLAPERPRQFSDAPDLRDYVEIALRGGFPEPLLELDGGESEEWLDSYVAQLLLHERAQGRNGADHARLAAFFEAYATCSAGLVHDATLAKAVKIDSRTAQSYTRLLIDLGVVAELPAWLNNRLKRIARMPKRHVTDTGLWASAIGADIGLVMSDGDLLGRLIDTFVTNQLRVEAEFDPLRPRLRHLRDRNGRFEVDLIVDLRARGIIGVEIKAKGAIKAAHAKHLMWLRDELGDKFLAGVVFHTGPNWFTLSERIEAIPICALWH